MSEIDWKHWQRVASVKDWEAAALSLGIDPHKLKRNAATHEFRSSSFRGAEEKQRFLKRVREVHAYAEECDESTLAVTMNGLGLG